MSRTGEALSRNAMIYPKRKPGDDISFLFLRLQAVRASGCAVAPGCGGNDDGMVAAASWGDGIAAALLVYGEIYGQGLTHWTGRNPGHSAIVVCSVSCRAVALNDVLHFVHCRQNGSTLLPTFLLATSARP